MTDAPNDNGFDEAEDGDNLEPKSFVDNTSPLDESKYERKRANKIALECERLSARCAELEAECAALRLEIDTRAKPIVERLRAELSEAKAQYQLAWKKFDDSLNDKIGILKERDTLTKRVKRLEGALEFLLGAKMVVDEATVPKAGIEAAPEQVVFNWSCSYARIKLARKALAGEGD